MARTSPDSQFAATKPRFPSRPQSRPPRALSATPPRNGGIGLWVFCCMPFSLAWGLPACCLLVEENAG